MGTDSRKTGLCSGCSTRREFLGDSAALLAAVAAALTTRPAALGAWSFTSATASQGDTRTYPLPAADGVTIDRDEQVIIVRYQGGVFAFNLACPHENTALRWRQADGRFQCPRHESKYRPDGLFMEGRATRNMDRFAVHRVGENVVVDLARLFQSDTNPAEWGGAVVKV